jgi:hypothetical protein
MKISEKNLNKIIDNLILLKDAFANNEISTMIFDGDEEDKIEELQELVEYLNETK